MRNDRQEINASSDRSDDERKTVDIKNAWYAGMPSAARSAKGGHAVIEPNTPVRDP